jgi:predicted DNA-binding transcriptional regulator YafY
MRHEKSAKLLDLARELAVSRMGLTLDQMAQRMEVSRRTAERMRDQLLIMFDTMREINDDPPHKRWRIDGKFDKFMQVPSATEMSALKIAHNSLDEQNLEAAQLLKSLETKIIIAMGENECRRMETDLEVLLEAEAIAISPGPRPKYDAFTLNILREAIISMRLVSFIYAGGTRGNERRELIPYGIVFGGEAYLIAKAQNSPPDERPRVYRIDRIREAKLSEKIGAAPEDFSLRAFSERSFGVFQEDTTYEVKLEVLPDYVEEAHRWVFHPNQKFKELKNGGVEITMNGSSMRELAWSLFRWGDKIRIIAPQELKDEMTNAIESAQIMVGKKKRK